MNRTKRGFCVLLCIVLCLGILGGALAEEAGIFTAALEAGREICFDAQFSWYDNGLVTDESVNQAIAALFDALSFQGTMAKDGAEESMYSTFALLMSGSETMTFDQLVKDGTVYLQSPILGDNIALRPEDVGLYLQKVGAYMDSLGLDGEEPTGFEEMFGAMIPELDQMMAMTTDSEEALSQTAADPEEALLEMYATMGLDGALEAAIEWMGEKMEEAVAVEADIESVFGRKATHATAYVLGKDDLIEYFEVLRPHLETNEAFFGWCISMLNANTLSGEETVTLEEVMAEVPAEFDRLLASLEEIPEEATLTFSECYDESDEIVLYQFALNVPTDEETEEISMYGEIDPEGLPLYLQMLEGAGGMTLTVVSKAADDTQDNGFSATLSIIDNGEIGAEITMQTTSIESETEDGRVWDGALKIAMVEAGQEMGLNLSINQADIYTDEDIVREINALASLLVGEMEIPMVGFTANVYTAEPSGAPFEADDSFVEVAHLDEEAFAEHMTHVSASSLQMVFKLLSELPPEVFNIIVEQTQSLNGIN